MSERKFIYRCSWVESKRHKKPHTTMCFEKAEHTEWVFETGDWFQDLVKVEYIMVDVNQQYYKSAVANSNIAFWEAKQVQLMKEFEKYGDKECVICYESRKWSSMGVKCKACKNSMCFECCCDYSTANQGKFQVKDDGTGYGVDEKQPCPICRTLNVFRF